MPPDRMIPEHTVGNNMHIPVGCKISAAQSCSQVYVALVTFRFSDF